MTNDEIRMTKEIRIPNSKEQSLRAVDWTGLDGTIMGWTVRNGRTKSKTIASYNYLAHRQPK